MDIVFEFAYTDCIYESAMGCISLHKTKKGAETAMYLHKEQEKQEWLKRYPTKEKQKNIPFGVMNNWGVYKRKIQD